MTHKQTIIISLFTLLSLLTAPTGLISQENELLQRATAALEAGDYQSAISQYIEITESGYTSPDLEYNLGTSYLKQEDGANAILHLRRALKESPRHSAAQHNLKIARNIVETEISLIPDFFLLRYWRSLYRLLSSSAWAVVGFTCLLGIVAAVYAWLFPQSRRMKRMAFSSGIAFTILTLVCLLAGYGRHADETSTDQAVITAASDFYIGADDRSESLGYLSTGVECVIVDQIGDFLKIQLRDKEIGWIEASKLTII